MVFYDGRVIDTSPKQRNWKLFETPAFDYDTKSALVKVTCGKDFKDRTTLIVEGERIDVKSFVLIDNSPVFKEMLRSILSNEDGTKTIELPGKSLKEIVHLLEHVQY